jgi:hypothetical protein
LKLQEEGVNISIEFGTTLFEKLDLLNKNLDRIATALEKPEAKK